MTILGCGAEMAKLMAVSDEDVQTIEDVLKERLDMGIARPEAQRQAVAEAIAIVTNERAVVMGAIAAKIAALPAPAKSAGTNGRVDAKTQAQADLENALADLGDIFSKPFKSFIMPEQEQKLLPVLTRVMDAAFRLGYYKFKDAARFVIDTIRSKMGNDVADQITLDHLQGAYIGMAGKYQGQGASTKKEVVAVESLADLNTAAKPSLYTAEGRAAIAQMVADHLIGDGKFASINDARKFITEKTGEGIPPGTKQAKMADETVELGVVMAAREIVQAARKQGRSDEIIFDRLVNLYNAQPNLAVRDSTSIRNQAYSTPVPMAFVASRLAGIKPGMKVGELTAGNGALMIEVDPKDAVVNELNPDRMEALRSQGFTPTNEDATTLKVPAKSLDAINMNPPFGALDGKRWDIGGLETGEIDHAIVMKSLEALKDDGSAVFIIGGVNARETEARRQAYRGKAKREFFATLYGAYNVVDHFTLDGGMYSRQGAGFPVDVLVIRGRGKSKRMLPAATPPKFIENYDQLKEKLNETYGGVEPSGSGAGVGSDSGAAGVNPDNGRVSEPAGGAPGRPVRGSRAGGQTGSDGASDGGRTDLGTTGPAGNATGVANPAEPGSAGNSLAQTEPVVSQGGTDSQGQRQGSRASDAGNQPAGLGDSAAGKRTTDRQGVNEAAEAGKLQVKYESFSKNKSVNTLVATNHLTAIENAFQNLRARVGDVDAFVRKELDYEPEQFKKAFSAEQVEALALAIDNIRQGKGFIIGDQTGIGKGRVVAAMIRYAKLNGKTPVFVTQMPDLYGDMMRDLNDIGMSNMRPLMTNNNASVPLDAEALAWFGEVQAIKSKVDELNDEISNILREDHADKLKAMEPKDADKELRNLAKISTNPEVVSLRQEIAELNESKPAKRGKFLDTPNIEAHEKMLADMVNADNIGDYDVIFTTYTQMDPLDSGRPKKDKNTGQKTPKSPPKFGYRDTFLTHFINNNAMLILDESHNAGAKGDGKFPSRGDIVRKFITNSGSVFYSSATFAKNPEVMDAYSKTDLGKAFGNSEELTETVSNVPIQQVTSTMLVEAGQYLRRERSFDGIEYDSGTVEVDQQAAEDVSTAMRLIVAFDKAKKGAIKDIQNDLDQEGAAIASTDGGASMASVDSVNFTSVMHNVINTFLLALKSDAAADAAVQAIRNGEKPVLTVANTMEMFINEYAKEAGITIGDKLDATFADVLKRYLEKTRYAMIRRPGGSDEKVYLSDEQLGPDGLDAYNLALEFIEDMELNIPLSPIDHIKAKIEEAGFSIGEITGRQTVVVGGVLRQRNKAEMNTAGKKNTIAKFNNGQLDALIINRSGSTGLSMHASETFADQRRRVMVIAQAELDINNHMQMLGRVNRTGQVTANGKSPAANAMFGLPRYVQLSANVPIEMRPAAVLANKMANLNANTTAGRKSAVEAKNVPDFMNKYGDRVAAELVGTNPELNERLGYPLKPNDDGEIVSDGAMAKVTGRIGLLPLKQQSELYEALASEYQDLIAQLEALGQNELEAKTYPLDAKTLEKRQVMKADSGPQSPFTQAVFAETVSMRKLGRPYPKAKVQEMVAASLGGKTATDVYRETLTAVQGQIDKEVNDLERQLSTADPKNVGGIEKQITALKAAKVRFREMLPGIGMPYVLKTESGNIYGVVTAIEKKGKAKSAGSLSAWKIKFAVVDGARSMTIPMTQLANASDKASANAIEIAPAPEMTVPNADRTGFDTVPVMEAFDRGQTDARETRIMITGNILRGYGALRGRLMNYTDDQGNIRQGILMPADKDMDDIAGRFTPSLKTAQDMIDFLNKGGVLIDKDSVGSTLKVTMSGSRIRLETSNTGLGKKLVKEAQSVYFASSGSRMVANLYDEAEFAEFIEGPVAGLRLTMIPNAATVNLLRGDDDADGVAFSRVQAPGLYSALSREIAALPTKSAPAMGWQMAIAGLVKNGKVKADELEWSGLTDWLKLQTGKVTKEQITGYLDANGVQVQEMTLGIDERRKKGDFLANEFKRLLVEKAGFSQGDASIEVRRQREDRFAPVKKWADQDVFAAATALKEADGNTESNPKYEQYTLPGGENYREVLLTLPGGKEIGSYAEWLAARMGVSRDEAEDLPEYENDELHAQFMREEARSKKSYHSSHWDQPNVLAHLRVNDRTDADGNRVLFVEEIQSDWGQSGKKKGWKEPLRVAAQVRGGKKNGTIITKDGARLHADLNLRADDWPGMKQFELGFVNKRGEFLDRAQVGMDAYRYNNYDGVPPAPFVTATDKWLNLALKRIITMAVEGGYDKIAFVNGEQSADRYDLSKQISKVEANRPSFIPDDKYDIRAYGMSGNPVHSGIYSASELEGVVGKELTKKIVEDVTGIDAPMKVYSGLDLKVGGEGMKTFYDQIVPNAVKALAKKLGGDVSRVEFDPESMEEDAGPTIKQPGLAITDTMREKAAGGLPLFAKNTQFSPAAQAQSIEAVERVAAGIASAWQNAPRIVVAFDMQDARIPERARQADLKQRKGGARGAPEGFYYNGTAYLMASQLRTPNDTARVLFHEALGHFGLRRAFGDSLKPILQQIVTMRRAQVDAKIKEYELLGVSNIDRMEAAEEVLAEMAQTTPNIGFVTRAVAAIRTWLRANVPGFKDLALTDAEIIRSYILPARGWVEKGGNNGGARGGLAFARSKPTDQTNTPAFRAWFGDSKVVDAEGKPLVVYHGTPATFTAFDPKKAANGMFGKGFYFTDNRGMAEDYADGGNVMAVYLALNNPAPEVVVNRVVDQMGEDDQDAIRAELERLGYDGVLMHDAGETLAVAFRPEQIKSATDNNGNFDPTNPDIRFSRATTARDLTQKATEAVRVFTNTPGKVNWWHKTVGTQYNLAQRSPEFKRVYDAVQDFIGDVSFYATEAADLAPKILPKLDTWRDIAKSPLSADDTKAIAAPIFEGTLVWARNEAGQPVKVAQLEEEASLMSSDRKAQRLLRNDKISEGVLKMWRGLPLEQYEALIESKYAKEMLKAGVVWSPEELKSRFGLTGEKGSDGKWTGQIGLYKEFREATDKSLANLAISDMLYFGGKDVAPIKEAVLEAKTVVEASEMLRDYLLSLADMDPDNAESLIATANKMIDKGDRAADLMARGYAPLSRFGTYTLDVVDDNGERVYFGLFESRMEADRMAKQMAAEYPGGRVEQGTLSEESYKLFAGVSPETVALFGDMLGLEDNGAYQDYLKLAKSTRSAMKRLIERKGIAGFSEDAGRVLAGFVYSNARQTSQNMHTGEMVQAANDIPKGMGELKDKATQLVEYIKHPVDEAQKVRGLLFAQYIGGSVASAMVNMTQPFTMTMPWLSQFGGLSKAAKQMSAAVKDATRKTTGNPALDAALKRGEEDGTVSPQEVHDLMRQAQGKGALKSGDGTKLGNATAGAQNAVSRIAFAWGKLFSTAEQFNRRVTFIAAYRTAVEQGMSNPDAFARRAIHETQGVYNKGNKPDWARGAVGSTLFTFKQYSIAYVEMLHRMATTGAPGSPERAAGRRGALYALAVLLLLSGVGGLPGADDLDDIISGLMQALGYNFDSKAKRKAFLAEYLGDGAQQFIERGVSGIYGVPIDVSGRLGLGNLVPATGLLTKKADHTSDVVEILGPAGDLAKRAFQAGGKLIAGDVLGTHGAIATASPKAVQNLFQAADMATTGMYRDARGKKVIETSPGDALSKALGFQPNDVKRQQDATWEVKRMVDLNRITEAEIADRWAIGLFEKDAGKVQAARDDLARWNADNPSSPIKINLQQIRQRVNAMNMTKAERIAKAAPKELRAQVREALSQQ